jgi:hypothetical protein
MTDSSESVVTPPPGRFLVLRGRLARTWPTSLVVIAGTIMHAPLITRGLNEQYAFRQTQTAFTIREYARSGIDLVHPLVPVLGRPWTIPMEFPLFQAIASVPVTLGLSSDAAGRLLGLISFQASAILLAILVERWADRRSAVVTLVLFEFTPFGMQWGAASLIEFFAVALVLGMILGIAAWFESGSRRALAVGSVCAWAAYAVKATTAFPWTIVLLACAVVTVRKVGWERCRTRVLVGLGAAPGVAIVLASWWFRVSDAQKLSNPFTTFLTQDSLREWHYGTLAQRLDPTNLAVILHRVTDLIVGPGLVLFMVGVILVVSSRFHRIMLLSVALVPFLAVAVFYNLYVVHTYYLCAIAPALVAVAGVGASELATRLARSCRIQNVTAALVVLSVLTLTWTSGMGIEYATGFRDYRGVAPYASTVIDRQTPNGAHILVIGCDWDPLLRGSSRTHAAGRPGADLCFDAARRVPVCLRLQSGGARGSRAARGDGVGAALGGDVPGAGHLVVEAGLRT